MNAEVDRYALPQIFQPVGSGRHVAILGAGFSRAISEAMPTLQTLGERVITQLGLAEASPLDEFDGSLERWMSFLSADQPWLSEAGNLRNRSVFVDAAQAVSDAIATAEQEAVAQPVPQWLYRLVWTWAETGADVFTFNYDTLVERALAALTGWDTLSDVYATALAERVPPGSGAFLGPGNPDRSLFRLYKLHGSTNWSFSGLSAPINDPIVLTQDRPPWRPDSRQANTTPRYVALYDGLAPLIVPPTYSKGPYYGNLALRAQWARGASALANASDAAILGYSFPPGDLTTREWIGTSLSPSATLAVADWCAETADRVLMEVGKGRGGTPHSGEKAISDFVNATCGDLITWQISHQVSGVRLEVLVNGAPIGLRQNGHFGSSAEAAQWVEARIDAAAPRRTEQAQPDHHEWPVELRRTVVMPPDSPHVVFDG